MPERQSSPGEATASSEPESTSNVRDAGGVEHAATPDAKPEGARPAPAPRPSPRPAAPPAPAPEGDENPTVRTVTGRAPSARGANGEHANGHAANGHAAGGHAANGHAAGEAATVRVAAHRPGGSPHPHAEPPEPPGRRPAPPAGEQRPGEAATVVVPAAAPGAAPRGADGATQMLPRTPAPPFAADEPATERIERIPPAAQRGPLPPPEMPTQVDLGPPDGPGGPGGTDGDKGPRRGRKRVLVLSAVVAALGLLYGADLLLGSGTMPRGVTVAGIGVGGLSREDAETKLRAEIGARTSGPIPVTVGDVRGEIDPAAAGLSVDWPSTMDRAGSQPLNPITRITSFFSEREVGVVTIAEPDALAGALEQLGPVVDREPSEGTVRFEGTEPQPVEPRPGQRLDVPAAGEVLKREWANGEVVALPIAELPPTTTSEDVTAAIEQVARPAVAAPITVIGEDDVRGTVDPEVIAAALSFEAENGALAPKLNQQVIQDALAPQMADSEEPARDATFDFSGGRAVVVPSKDGRGVDYEATVAALVEVLGRPAPREVTAVYADKPAEVTTEELEALGNPEVIGEFTTGGFAPDSGINIRRAAELINGTVVQPGEVFSLDKATGPRTAANGYVEAGVIDNGRASRGIAGGASQVSTTLYNAAYFAGMTLLEHKAHSYYISRYPAGREATIATGAIDNKFRNDNPTPIMIRTRWTPTSVTVQIYGQRRYEVTGEFGPRTNPTQPHTVTIPAGEDCHPSNGSPGFTITDTRTRRDIQTGEVTKETFVTKYNPAPRVVCED
jgi:vancomycin resistance protein YoaR